MNKVSNNEKYEKHSATLLSVLSFSPIIGIIPLFLTTFVRHYNFKIYSQVIILWLIGVFGWAVLVTSSVIISKKDLMQTLFKKLSLPFCLLLMLLWSILSTIFSTNVFTSTFGTMYRFDGFYSYLAYAGIFILALQVRSRKSILIILNIFVATASSIAFFGLLNIHAINRYLILRPQYGTFENQNHYGYYLCMALPCALWLYVIDGEEGRRPNVSIRILRILGITFLCNGIIQAVSMGPLVAVLSSMLVLTIVVFFRFRREFKRLICIEIYMIFVMGISAAGTWNLMDDSGQMVKDFGVLARNMSGTADMKDEDALNSIGSSRGVLWRYAVQFMKERPLFGYGPDNLGARYAEVGCTNDRAHNEFLQYGASLGIPALVFYIAGLWSLFWQGVKNFKKLDLWTVCSCVVVISYLVNSLFGNTMYYTVPFYWMLLGICYRQVTMCTDERQS